MNQAQDMLKAMLTMTIQDVKNMHGLDHSEIVAVLTEVAEDPALKELAKTDDAVTPVAPAWNIDKDGNVIAEDTEGTVEVVSIDGVDTVNITTVETVEKKPAKKAAAKKTAK